MQLGWLKESKILKLLANICTRLEIISDVVSERHVAEKFRYHIGNTDTTSAFSDTTSEIPMWYRKKTMWCRYFRCGIGISDVVSVFPMWYRYFRCGIGIFPLRASSDTTSEIISNRVTNLGNILIFENRTEFTQKIINHGFFDW